MYHILLNCIPRSGSHYLMDRLLERFHYRETYTPHIYNKNSKFRGWRIIHNHLHDVEVSRSFRCAPVFSIILRRDEFSVACSTLVMNYTGEYNQYTYTDRVYQPFVASLTDFRNIVLSNRLRLQSWRQLRHPLIVDSVEIKYEQLFEDLSWLYDRLGISRVPVVPPRDDTVRPSVSSTRSVSSMLLNIDTLRNYYLNELKL